MTIVGCDYHPGWQEVAVFDSETGEIRKLRLENGNGEDHLANQGVQS